MIMVNLDLKVLAVVVTYNRLKCLKNCVSALRKQTYKCVDIMVVNNGSNDGTAEWLHGEKGLFVIYQNNCGGAGGFYAGMKHGYENGYDAIWMMDDDGMPDCKQLEELIRVSCKYEIDYANALLLNKDFPQLLCTGGEYKPEKYKRVEYIPNFVLPFNGTLIKRHVIEKIGLIKKEMFIWGDEKEYTLRVKANGFRIGTVVSAIHYHPAFKGDIRNVIPFCNKWKIVFKPSPRDKIFYRNLGYIDHAYGTKYFLKYLIYYIIRLRVVKLPYIFKYMSMGWNNNFNERLE